MFFKRELCYQILNNLTKGEVCTLNFISQIRYRIKLYENACVNLKKKVSYATETAMSISGPSF